MKRLITILVLLSMSFAMVNAAAAQSERKVSLLLAGDLAFAATPDVFTDYYIKGFGATVGLEYNLDPTWAFQFGLNYKQFSPDAGMIKDWYNDPDEYPSALNPEVSEGAVQAATIFATTKAKLRSPGARTYPYIRGGFGITMSGADEVRVDYVNPSGYAGTNWHGGADSATDLSAIMALGLEFASSSSHRSFFCEVGINAILKDGSGPGMASLSVGFTL